MVVFLLKSVTGMFHLSTCSTSFGESPLPSRRLLPLILIILHQLIDWEYLAPVDVSVLRFHLGGIRCDWCLNYGFGIRPDAPGSEIRRFDLWFPSLRGHHLRWVLNFSRDPTALLGCLSFDNDLVSRTSMQVLGTCLRSILNYTT